MVSSKKFIVAALVSLANAAYAVDYQPGFIWDRSADWTTEGLIYGMTTGNARPDALGNPTWSMEWVEGGGFESSAPWYQQASHLMIWDHWAPENGRPHDTWVRVDDLEPKITQYGISNSRSLNWQSWDYQALVRWNNPTGQKISTSIEGRLQLEWGAGSGYRISPDADVDVIVARYNAVDGSYTSLFAETISNPEAGQPYPPTTLDIPVSFQDVILGAEDSLVFSLRATTAPSEYDSWVILRDDVKIELVAALPEPATWLTMLAGLSLTVLAVRRRPARR